MDTVDESIGHPLLMLAAQYLIHPSEPPSLWEVGDHWVRFDGGKYLIDADEPATLGQVRELLLKSGFQAQICTEN